VPLVLVVAAGGASLRGSRGSSQEEEQTEAGWIVSEWTGVLSLHIIHTFGALMQFVATGGRSLREDGGSSGVVDRT
jgi:hypothetical protein